MLNDINFSDNSDKRVSFREPNICPMCAHSIQPILLYTAINSLSENNHFGCFSALFKCTHCHNSFISTYNMKYVKQIGLTTYFAGTDLLYSAPSTFKEETFPKCIETDYPSFVKIYNQSLKAEHYFLDEIAGIGYRKSLEFLIKDFLIYHEHKDEQKVKSTPLGSCISTMINNPQLKIVATRATWLGNDQTHYEQKYTERDINDLKLLIKLSVNWIEMIYLTEEAETIEKK